MPEARPVIPAELRRRVLIEAGHRCAIPTCRHIDVDIHHIIPWAHCQKHEYENLIALCPNCHRRAERSDIDRKALRIYKANLRFAHDKFSQFELDILFELIKLRGLQFPPFMALLIKRLLDANYARLEKNPHGQATSFGFQISPDILVITEQGIEFVNSLGLELGN